MLINDYCGSILTNYRDNNLDIYPKALSFYFHSQADIYDRTIGSTTYGKRPDFIWVNSGASANISGSPRFLYYRWVDLNSSNIISEGYTDSIKVVTKGLYEVWTVDGNSGDALSKDTISILEKPAFNNSIKTLNFPTTTIGITYKLSKVVSISETDTTWTEFESFVGDGNAKNLTLTDGTYKLTTTFGIHTAVYPYGYFVLGTTTALDKTKEEIMTYRLIDNYLQFGTEVNLKFYSLQGQLLQLEKGSSFNLVRQTGIFTATDKNGKTLTTKILLK